MNRLADAMAATGSWQVWGPTNVLGFDELDPPKLKAAVDMMIPIKPFSTALGEQVSWWAQASFPMHPSCAASPGACARPKPLWDATLKVPTAQLNEGYQFPTVTNPFTGEQTSWSGQYVKLDPAAPVNALGAYLSGPAQAVETVAPGDAAAAVGKLTKSVADAFNPFVQNSEWFNPEHSALAPVFRNLAPALCPSCDPDNPYDNPWLYENYPAKAAAPSAAVAAAGAAVAADTAAQPATEAAVNGIDVRDAAENVSREIRPGASAPVGEPRSTTGSGSADQESQPKATRAARQR